MFDKTSKVFLVFNMY